MEALALSVGDRLRARTFVLLLTLTHLVLLAILGWATSKGFQFHYASIAALGIAGTLIGVQDLWLAQWLHMRSRTETVAFWDTSIVPGVYSFRTFVQRVQEEISRATRHSENFSLIHLTFGSAEDHQPGRASPPDAATLRSALGRLRDNVRQEDCIARVGRSEVLVLLPGTGPVEVCLLAERLVKYFDRHPVYIGCRGEAAFLRIHLGTVTYPFDGDDAEGLLAACRERFMQVHEARVAGKA